MRTVILFSTPTDLTDLFRKICWSNFLCHVFVCCLVLGVVGVAEMNGESRVDVRDVNGVQGVKGVGGLPPSHRGGRSPEPASAALAARAKFWINLVTGFLLIRSYFLFRKVLSYFHI